VKLDKNIMLLDVIPPSVCVIS